MKIALVTDQLGAPDGADDYPVDPARRVLALARALAGQGQQVTVYSSQDPHIAALATRLAYRVPCAPPHVTPPHRWTSALAAPAGGRALDTPVSHTSHPLGPGAGARPARLLAGASDAARTRLEAAIGRGAAAVIAGTP